MDIQALGQLLNNVRDGTISPHDAGERLRQLPFADLGFARIDHHRELRQGFPEAIYGPSKTPEQCLAIVQEMLARGTGPVILTRANDQQIKMVIAECKPDLASGTTLVWRPQAQRTGRIAVLTAGTADLAVANECLTVLQAQGLSPRLVTDVGVAGLHRLLASIDALADVDAVVVIAGMEGALASVVGGLTAAPVIAVPTSTGYGASLEGVTALLSMMASCSAGVTVVGIDNGYGAACAVIRLLNAVETFSDEEA